MCFSFSMCLNDEIDAILDLYLLFGIWWFRRKLWPRLLMLREGGLTMCCWLHVTLLLVGTWSSLFRCVLLFLWCFLHISNLIGKTNCVMFKFGWLWSGCCRIVAGVIHRQLFQLSLFAIHWWDILLLDSLESDFTNLSDIWLTWTSFFSFESGVLLSLSLPFLYDKYQDQIDIKLVVAYDSVQVQYRKLDHKLLRKIPGMLNKEKKTQ